MSVKFSYEILFIILLITFSIWLYRSFFVTIVDEQKYKDLELDDKCKQYVSSLKYKQTFPFNLMVSAVSTIIVGIFFMLFQTQNCVNISTSFFFLTCVIVMLTSFTVSYKVFNCLISRTICGGGECF